MYNSTDTTRADSTGAFADHSRHWDTFKYVYPVVSRRSRGLSIGINLNPDTICNFDCVYCQVEKIEDPRPMAVNLDVLRDELDKMLGAVASGEIWSHPRFAEVDTKLRRLNDIAFSGDGEPTSAPCFADAVDIVVELKQTHGLTDAKLVLITNATLLTRPNVESTIQLMDKHQGEVWAKLDAGTPEYYKRMDRSAVPFKTILGNILSCGKPRPIVIQSLFMKLHDVPIPDEEFDAYADRLADLLDAGCRIKQVQLYTVARQPLEPYVTALTDAQLTGLADRLNARLGKVAGTKAVEVCVFGTNG